MPCLYSQSTCHFLTGEASVGGDEIDFALYYGLYKYTPIDSAMFFGYECLPYDPKYNFNPPVIPRLIGIVGLVLGTIPLIVIGVHLQYSVTSKILWVGSMWMLYFGCCTQLATLLSLFLSDLCQDGVTCKMGPGAWAAVVCAISWLTLSIEMKINSPLIQPVKSEGVVVIEKDSLFMQRMNRLWKRMTGQDTAPSLSRTAMKMQKQRIGKSEYRPPEIV